MHKTNPTCVPLHTDQINSHPVRFFRSPINDGRPDFPWTCLGDLIAAFGLTDQLRNLSGERLLKISAEAMDVATNDGMVTLIPHPDAQGFVHSMLKLQGVDAAEEYKYAGAAAFHKQLTDMTDKEVMAYSQAAVARWKE